MDWMDHPNCSTVFIHRPDGTMHKMTVFGPDDIADYWTAEASLLDPECRELKYSGMFHGGDTRDKAKAVALTKALALIA